MAFPMLENKKYFLRTWYTAEKNRIKLELISGYGFNEQKTSHYIDKNSPEDFFLQMGDGKLRATPAKNVNYSLHTRERKRTFKYSLRMSETTENNIETLRTKLFSAIEKLETGTMKHEEARAIASLAQTIINSAKLELEYKRMVEKAPDIKMLNS